METFNYNGVTSTPTTPLRLVVADALMAKVDPADTEPVTYTTVSGADAEGRPLTEETTRHLIRQDADTLDKYADVLDLRTPSTPRA